MTDHSIAELHRQMLDAKSKLENANISFLAAQKRHHDAMCKETGFLGRKLRTRNGRLFLATDVEFLSSKAWRVTGLCINKDGKVGFAPVSELVDCVKQEAEA